MGQWHRSDIERCCWINYNSDATLAICQLKCVYVESGYACLYFRLMRYDWLVYVGTFIRWQLSAILDNNYDK